MRQFKIIMHSDVFEGKLTATIEASNRGIAEEIANSMFGEACARGWFFG